MPPKGGIRCGFAAIYKGARNANAPDPARRRGGRLLYYRIYLSVIAVCAALAKGLMRYLRTVFSPVTISTVACIPGMIM